MGMTQAGARWLAEDRGLYDLSGQDTGMEIVQSQKEDWCRNSCPLFPLPLIARIDWDSIFQVFPTLKPEIH